MDNSEETPSRVLKEFIKLRLGIKNLASQMNVSRGTLHNYLTGDIKRENLIKILEAALEMGVQPFEIERELQNMGFNPDDYSNYTSYDNITDSTIISGNSKSKIRNKSIYGQYKEVAEKAEEFKKRSIEFQERFSELQEKYEYFKVELQKRREENQVLKKENQELKIEKAKLEGKLEAFKEMLRDQEGTKG